jgi:hypothetical protein
VFVEMMAREASLQRRADEQGTFGRRGQGDDVASDGGVR